MRTASEMRADKDRRAAGHHHRVRLMRRARWTFRAAMAAFVVSTVVGNAWSPRLGLALAPVAFTLAAGAVICWVRVSEAWSESFYAESTVLADREATERAREQWGMSS